MITEKAMNHLELIAQQVGFSRREDYVWCGAPISEAVITWHGDLIRSYAVQAASEKITRLANETITMLREKREKVQKEDGSIAARAVIARMGKAELRTDATKREQVIDLLVTHRHLIPVARKGHYMMMVPHV